MLGCLWPPSPRPTHFRSNSFSQATKALAPLSLPFRSGTTPESCHLGPLLCASAVALYPEETCWQPSPRSQDLRPHPHQMLCCSAACTLHILVPSTAAGLCPSPGLLGAVCCATKPRVQWPGWNVALPPHCNYSQLGPKTRAEKGLSIMVPSAQGWVLSSWPSCRKGGVGPAVLVKQRPLPLLSCQQA